MSRSRLKQPEPLLRQREIGGVNMDRSRTQYTAPVRGEMLHPSDMDVPSIADHMVTTSDGKLRAIISRAYAFPRVEA